MTILTIIMLIAGALFIIGAIFGGVYAFSGTPSHLKGYYGKRYLPLMILAILGGIALIVISFLI